ncbi:MAG: hypothetical protein KIT10_07065 [Flavobacteriales bacterium]|nr:hypothetical protein [Flavobacteriales bacterium]
MMLRNKKYKLVLMLLVASGVCFVGCGGGEKAGHGDVPQVAAQEVGGLELDDGSKWRLGPHMMGPVRRMQERLSATSARELTAEGSAARLADSLFADMDELVRACDMKGKGHDVLHDWLMPHMSLLQRLERTSDPDSVAQVLAELDRSNTLFDRYFE